MAVITCPNCRSAVSSRERRCWICQKALAPPATHPRGRKPTYPERMRLVRIEESAGIDSLATRIVYVKSVEDPLPNRRYRQEQNLERRRLRQACAGLAASLAFLLAVLLIESPPLPPAPTVAVVPSRVVAAPAANTAPLPQARGL